jgi:hypothetical protein
MAAVPGGPSVDSTPHYTQIIIKKKLQQLGMPPLRNATDERRKYISGKYEGWIFLEIPSTTKRRDRQLKRPFCFSVQ